MSKPNVTNPETSSSTPLKKPRQIRTELDRLLMDEGTVNMLCDTTPAGAPRINSSNGPLDSSATKKAKLEVLKLKRLQVLSTVRNQSGDSGKKLREKKKPETKICRRRSEEGYPNGNITKKGTQGSWFKGRRASLLATLKEERNGKERSCDGVIVGNKAECVEGSHVQNRILGTVTQDGLGRVTITFQANGRWTIDLKTLRDLTNILQIFESNPKVKVILVSSSGTKFCNGIDLRELIGTDKKKIAEEMAEAINSYLVTLSTLSKLTIISLHSSVSNLFVTSLPLFDLVYASDKCTFRCNYLILNQVPEGGSLLHDSLGRPGFNNLIYGKRILTANEAKECGLVTEVLWPAKFQEEVILRVRNYLRSKLSCLSRIKTTLPRLPCLSELGLAEAKQNLVKSWITEDFQLAATRFVNSRDLPI